MFQTQMTRRGFLVGCSAAIAGMAGARVSNVALAASPEQAASRDVLVVLFLRGGWDALSVLPPIDGPDRGIYEKARPRLKLPTKGAGAALRLTDQFGVHPRMAPLLDLYRDKKLAIVQAAGLKHSTRSHFDAMEYIELGTPGTRTTTSGWITRHLNAQAGNSALVVPAVGVGTQPTSLLAMNKAIAISNVAEMKLPDWDDSWNMQQSLLRKLYASDDWIGTAGRQAFSAIETIQKSAPGEYRPQAACRTPTTNWARALKRPPR